MPVEGFVIRGAKELAGLDDSERVSQELAEAYGKIARGSGKILFEGIVPSVEFAGGNTPVYRQDVHIIADIPEAPSRPH